MLLTLFKFIHYAPAACQVYVPQIPYMISIFSLLFSIGHPYSKLFFFLFIMVIDFVLDFNNAFLAGSSYVQTVGI